MIYASSDNGVIGFRGGIPWAAKEEQGRFKAATRGKTIVMGRRTYESLPGRLPGRRIFVVSSQTHSSGDVVWVESLSKAFDLGRAQRLSEIMIAGGASLYAEALPLCDVIYQSTVHVSVDGDVFAPKISARQFSEIWSRQVEAEPSFSYRTYVRNSVSVPAVDPTYGLITERQRRD
jgi:dihydrofolate reductase